MWRISAFLLALVLYAVCLFPETSNAALLYFDPPVASLHRGDTVTVSLRLDTDEEECINTVDAVISYSGGVRAVDVSRGSSILNLWIEDPTINESEQTITFAGGITGGYCGRAAGDPSLTNVIAEIVFLSPGFSVGGSNNLEANIFVSETSSVLLNDGLGTPAELRRQDATITLLSTPGQVRSDEWRETVVGDTVPPSDFTITLAQDTAAFSGSYFITWNSQDKQSGIDHYEVMEEPLEDFYAFEWGRADAPWVEATSPYVLKDQTLNSTIRVKAIDKAGNETIAVLVPDTALRTLSSNRLFTITILGGMGVILLGVLIYILMDRRRKILQSYDETL